MKDLLQNGKITPKCMILEVQTFYTLYRALSICACHISKMLNKYLYMPGQGIKKIVKYIKYFFVTLAGL